jgi:hypothetical protein
MLEHHKQNLINEVIDELYELAKDPEVRNMLIQRGLIIDVNKKSGD